MGNQVLIGIASVAVGFVALLPYFRDIMRKRTKPHAITWFIWTIIMGIAFFVSVSKGGGAGAWLLGMNAILYLTVFVLALSRGEKKMLLLDKLCLVAGLLGIVLWVTTNNPLNAVVMVTLVDAVAFVPTFRKTYKKPYEETLSQYALSGLSLVISLFALQSVSVTTVLYPASLVFTSYLFVTMTLIRRGGIANAH